MNAETIGAGKALAAAASDCIGTRFRLHGRDPATGLDCVGLVEVSLRQIGHPFDAPSDYALRTLSTGPLLESLRDCPARRLRRAADDRTGDIVLCAVGPAQSHLVIIDRNQAPDARAQTTFIHAHAGLRRVVRTPGRPPWPVVARWRMD